MATTISCSWCHYPVPGTEPRCPVCGHDTGPRMTCRCPRCADARRPDTTGTTPPHPLAAVEQVLAGLRRRGEVGRTGAANSQSTTPAGTGDAMIADDVTTPTPTPRVTTGSVPVSTELAAAIRRMGSLLEDEFGDDFAFAVLAGGGLVAADNSRDGIVLPRTHAADPK